MNERRRVETETGDAAEVSVLWGREDSKRVFAAPVLVVPTGHSAISRSCYHYCLASSRLYAEEHPILLPPSC